MPKSKRRERKACQSNHSESWQRHELFFGCIEKIGNGCASFGFGRAVERLPVQSGKVGRREGAFLVFSSLCHRKEVLAAGQTGKGICLPADVLDRLPEKKLFKLLVDQMKVVIQRVL